MKTTDYSSIYAPSYENKENSLLRRIEYELRMADERIDSAAIEHLLQRSHFIRRVFLIAAGVSLFFDLIFMIYFVFQGTLAGILTTMFLLILLGTSVCVVTPLLSRGGVRIRYLRHREEYLARLRTNERFTKYEAFILGRSKVLEERLATLREQENAFNRNVHGKAESAPQEEKPSPTETVPTTV